MRTIDLIISLFLILCFILFFVSGVFFAIGNYDLVNDFLGYGFKPIDHDIEINLTTNLTECNSSNFDDDISCLRTKFIEIFKYNITPDYAYHNFSEVDAYIRKYGGDCHEAAIWYNLSARMLGYNTKYVSFVIRQNETDDLIYRYLHAVAIISNDEGYCIADQYSVRCSRFINSQNLTNVPKEMFFKSLRF